MSCSGQFIFVVSQNRIQAKAKGTRITVGKSLRIVMAARSFPRTRLTKPSLGKKEKNPTPETQKSRSVGTAISVVGLRSKLWNTVAERR